jgi:hypothetical protein
VSAEQVALIPEYAECGEVWLPADDDRWRAYLSTDNELVGPRTDSPHSTQIN